MHLFNVVVEGHAVLVIQIKHADFAVQLPQDRKGGIRTVAAEIIYVKPLRLSPNDRERVNRVSAAHCARMQTGSL